MSTQFDNFHSNRYKIAVKTLETHFILNKIQLLVNFMSKIPI